MMQTETTFNKIRKSLSKKKRLALTFLRALTLSIKLVCLNLFGILSKKNLVIIALYEHIGDVISCEPVVGYVKKQFPNTLIHWVIKKDYAELIQYDTNIDGIEKLNYFYEWILIRKLLLAFGYPLKKIIDLHINGKPCPVFKKKLQKGDSSLNFNNHLIGRSQLEAFSISAGLGPINEQPHFYYNIQDDFKIVDEKYVVFHTQSNMTMKDWNDEDWNCLCLFLIKSGYYVAEAGIVKHIHVKSPMYLDFTGKKSLQRIATVIKKSTLFVGIDSGFAHMANALKKDGLVLIGQYKIDKTVFSKYNPFTGLYANPNNIIYAENGLVSTLTCNTVKKRVAEKLKIKTDASD